VFANWLEGALSNGLMRHNPASNRQIGTHCRDQSLSHETQGSGPNLKMEFCNE